MVAETKLGLKTWLAFRINQLNYWPLRRPCQATSWGKSLKPGPAPFQCSSPHWYTLRFSGKKAFFPYLLHFSPLFSQDKAIIDSFPFYLYPLVIAKVFPIDLRFNINSMSWGNIIHAVSWRLKENICFICNLSQSSHWGGKDWGGGAVDCTSRLHQMFK